MPCRPTLAREAGLIEELSRMGVHDELSEKPIARGTAPTAAEAIAAMTAVSWKRNPEGAMAGVASHVRRQRFTG